MKKASLNLSLFINMLVSLTCLYYMHHNIMTDTSSLNLYSHLYNIYNSIIDICLIYLPFIFLSYKNKYFTLIPTIVICIIAFSHTLYNHYFNSYIPFSLYTEFNNLNGLSANIISGLSYNNNIVYVSIIILGTYIIYNSAPPFHIKKYTSSLSIIIIISFTCSVITSYIEWEGNVSIMKIKTRNRYTRYRSIDYAKSMFELGIVQNLACDLFIHQKKNQPLTKLETDLIKKYIPAQTYSHFDSLSYNYIFIITESLLSNSIELKYNNKEVTPILNQLKKEGYYNKHMVSEIEQGESSDGQFIYMTGILPEKQGITIIDFFQNQFISFVELLKEKNPNYTSRMIIPTPATFWRQNEMCKKYSIDSLFSQKDFSIHEGNWLNDEEIFKMAISKDQNTLQPFISFILTISTHSPYDNSIQKSLIEYPTNYPMKYRNYLDKVNYTDTNIGKYINFLKQQSWFSNTIIIIVSDHQAHLHLMDMQNSNLSTELPLLILNTNYIKRSADSTIYQSDIYPTILDIAGIDTEWRGVGKSLCMPDSVAISSFEKEKEKHKKQLSNILLKSNYFKINQQ